MRSAVVFLVFAFSVGGSMAKIYERCEFVEELYYKYDYPRNTLANWTCLAEAESSYNTAATNVNTNESQDNGIYQINDKYWCYSTTNPTDNDCNINCDVLRDDDIGDDNTCAQIIYGVHKFEAWNGWIAKCQGVPDKELEATYIDDCNV